MKRVLVDTNVVLDVLLDRTAHIEGSSAIWAVVESGLVEGMVSAHAVTTIHYLVRSRLGTARATRTVAALLRVFKVATVDSTAIRDGLEMSLPDFEDSVTAAAARLAGCDCIVTRDAAGFRSSRLPCLTPEAAVALFATE